MPKLTKCCLTYFHTKDLYSVLGIPKTASNSEVKKAYYKVSLKIHPDRVTDDVRKVATEKFQILGKVYSILSDKEKRTIYDDTGEVDEENEMQDRDWNAYWRLCFKKITVADIEKFMKNYHGSQAELDDLKEAYNKFEGDMTKIMDAVPCAELDDEDRLRGILSECIEKGDVKAYDAFTNESPRRKAHRRRKQEREADEAAKYRKELGLDEICQDGDNSLELMIRQKQEKRMDDLVSSLEKKYGGKASRKRSVKSVASNPSAEEETKQASKKKASGIRAETSNK